MKPTIGRIVIVNLDSQQQIELNNFIEPSKEGKEAAALIVNVKQAEKPSSEDEEQGEPRVTLRVFCTAAPKDLMIYDAKQGDELGQWHEPVRSK